MMGAHPHGIRRQSFPEIIVLALLVRSGHFLVELIDDLLMDFLIKFGMTGIPVDAAFEIFASEAV